MKRLLERIQAEASKGEMDVDVDVYAAAGKDPTWPILNGSGDPTARLAVFGRDPGRHEVIHGEPFIGAGGQLVRKALHEAAFQEPCPDLAGSIRAGQRIFWANTVPYKPTGNKAWSVKVKRRFVPFITEVLVHRWQGDQLITLGNVAFDWFRLADKTLGPTLKAFWAREDRYRASLTITLHGKDITVHPLPHPSPLNATWYPKFPGLLRARLDQLAWDGR